MKMVYIIVVGLVVLGFFVMVVVIEGDVYMLEKCDWIFFGLFGIYVDGEYGECYQLQCGLQVYQELCVFCYLFDLISFCNFGEFGGLFWDECWLNLNDNCIVMQIVEFYGECVWDVFEINDEGDLVVCSGILVDQFLVLFENEQMVWVFNGGVLLLDLLLIVKVCYYGVDYVYVLLMGYVEVFYDVELFVGQYYNEYFMGGVIVMVLLIIFDGQVEYVDGMEVIMEQMVEDVVVFFVWMFDLYMEVCKQMGLMVLLYLFVFVILVYLVYCQVWVNVEYQVLLVFVRFEGCGYMFVVFLFGGVSL